MKQALHREALQSQIDLTHDDKIKNRQKETEHEEHYILENTELYDQLNREKRSRQQQYRQTLAEQMNFPRSNQKEKLQMKNEREANFFDKPSQDINPRIQSPNQVRNDLLDQISEKKLHEWEINEVRISLHGFVINP